MNIQSAAIQPGFSTVESWKYHTKQHLVRFDKGGRTLVVSFDPYNWPKNWTDPENPPKAWGHQFLAKQGYSILGVLSKRSVWFREKALIDFFATLRDEGFFKQFDRVVFYGTSKGGYGALAFSSFAPGSHIVAFAPQTTLHRPLIAFETRKYPAIGNWSGEVIDGAAEAASAATVQIFYDPTFKLDKLHVDRINSDAISRYTCRFMGHDLPLSLSAMGLLKPLARGAIDGTLSEGSFRRLLRSKPRLRWYYRSMVNRLIATGKYGIADRLADKRLDRKEDYDFFMLRKAVIASHKGDISQMNAILKRYEKTAPE